MSERPDPFYYVALALFDLVIVALVVALAHPHRWWEWALIVGFAVGAYLSEAGAVTPAA